VSRVQLPFQDAFPNYLPSDTFAESLGLNNLIDNIWDLRRKQGRSFDPLLYLGGDVMHEILLYSVSLWDFAESRAWGTGIIPRNHMGDPLVLMNVSRRWRQFITSSPQLWSYMLIDTDDKDVLEYLQLFFLLSRNRRLFIVLHGSGDVCDGIVMDLLGVGDRIDTLVYPPNVSRSTLARFQLYLNASHDQLEHVCRWHKLEVQSGMQQYLKHYSFPISIQNLWMSAVFPLSRLVTLSHFQSLSFLLVRISLNEFLPPAHNYRLELPRLEGLRVQTTLTSHHQVDVPINMNCRRLKFLDLRYTFELDLENLQEEPATWIEFDGCDALEELQIDLAIRVVTEDRLIEPLAGWLQMPVGPVGQRRRQMRKRLQKLRSEQQQEKMQGQQKEKLQELHMLQLQLQLQLREEKEQREQEEEQREQRERGQRERRQNRKQREQRWEQQREQREKRELQGLQEEEEQQQQQWEQEEQQQRVYRKRREAREKREQRKQRTQQEQWKQEQQEQREQREQHLRFMMSIYTRWRQWLSLPNCLTHIQQSSLKVTLSTHQEACRGIRNMVEEALVWSLPQLTELATSKVLPIFPKHLRKLSFHGFDMLAVSSSLPSITLLSLVSLEIIADIPDDLLVIAYIKVPQLRVLQVQVEDGPGTLHQHDWVRTTNNLLDHISLRIGIPRDKQGNHSLVFHLPQTQSFNVFSPHIPLHLYLAKPAPLLYTLNAGLGIISGPPHDQGRTLTAMWNEELVTEWISPCGIPSLAIFKTLISLQRIDLSQHACVLSEQSPTDTLFMLLEENIHTCPQLNSITLAQCPSSWPRFLCQLRKRNREAMLLGKTKCIEELGFCQPLHATIIRWLVDAIKARVLDVMERPPIREGNAWPMRPLEADGVFRSCYVCHITGMELGCLEYETRDVDCGRERGEGSKIYAC
jgi:hypothetical protein